ncbi:hypothetical protein GCM10009786_03830 [Leucobacter alluvii]|uniref:SRPBCC family protein n=1 Tax=Leucobacter alluvii TaxID=340321 RepID=A0ABN3B3R2_9MICO
MRIRTEFEAACPPDVAWRALHDPSVAAELYAPFLVMQPERAFPEALTTGTEMRARLRVFGALPVGAQLIRITDLPSTAGADWPRTMRDHGRPLTGPLALLAEWRHEMTISRSRASEHRAVWTDELHIGGALAPLFRPVLALMWRWRGRKLRRLARNWQ